MMTMVDPSGTPNFGNASFDLTDGNSSVRFRLEQPLDGALSADDQKKELMKYFDLNDDQLLFKARINLRGSQENFYECISGYVSIDYDSRNTDAWKLEKDASGKFVYGVFVVKKTGVIHFRCARGSIYAPTSPSWRIREETWSKPTMSINESARSKAWEAP